MIFLKTFRKFQTYSLWNFKTYFSKIHLEFILKIPSFFCDIIISFSNMFHKEWLKWIIIGVIWKCVT
jgi:hypothetical protein